MNRREFITAASAAIVVSAAGPERAYADCADQKYRIGNGVNYDIVIQPLSGASAPAALPRIQSAHPPVRPLYSKLQSNPAALSKLAGAYRELADLSVKDPNDKRGLLHEAKMHQYYCGGPVSNVHDTWAFLAWHRGFLYFHEKKLQLFAGNDFRLAAWDWETNAAVPVPWNSSWTGRPHATGQRIENLFVDACPRNDNIDLLRKIDRCTLQAWLFSTDFKTFAGDTGRPGNVFSGPHSDVHTCLGPFTAMSSPSTAAADPLFYAHHANVDRYWWYWATQYHRQVDEPFYKQQFCFYDDKGKKVIIGAKDLTPEKLNYSYDLPYDLGLFTLQSTPVYNITDFSRYTWPLVDTALSWVSSAKRQAIIGALGSIYGNPLQQLSLFRRAFDSLLSAAGGSATARLVELLRGNVPSFGVQVHAKLDPGAQLKSGQYYAIGLQKNDSNPPAYIGGFGAFSHDGHSHEITATCCFTEEALLLYLKTAGNVSVVWGNSDASGQIIGERRRFVSVDWNFLRQTA